MLVATNLSFTGFYGRYNILDSEFKERSSALAEACVDEALLKLTINENYAGNETISFPPTTCLIGNVSTAGVTKNFTTQAIFQNSYTNLEVSFNIDTYTVANWNEVENF